MEERSYSPILHGLSMLTAGIMFILIFMGGVVTSKGAGMSVPDWPTSFGYNMFSLPFKLWTWHDGVIYEHSHRLLGTAVGMSSILVVILALRSRLPGWVKILSVALLTGVILQGVLGGLRVKYDQDYGRLLRIIHGCIAQAVFCVAALMCAATSNWWWKDARTPLAEGESNGKSLKVLAISSVIIIFLQLIAGALVRHFSAAGAIPDLRLEIPPTNQAELFNLGYTGKPREVWLQFIHRVGAILVTVAALSTVLRVFRAHSRQKALFIPSVWILLLLLTQLGLGIYIILQPEHRVNLATYHVAVGALLLLAMFLLAARAVRRYASRAMGKTDCYPTGGESVVPA